jgi:hypothetical protein
LQADPPTNVLHITFFIVLPPGTQHRTELPREEEPSK